MSNKELQREAHADRLALKWYAFPGVGAGIVALTWFLSRGFELLPVAGVDSIGRTAIYLAGLTGLIVFPLSYVNTPLKQTKSTKKWVQVRDVITLTFAYNVVLLAGMAILTYLLDAAFQGLLLDPYTSAAIVAMAVAVAAYVMIYSALTVDLNRLIFVLATVLIGGVLLAMITNSQADWWQVHFSYLGMASSGSPLRFNLTLIFSALVMLSLTEYIFSQLEGSTSLRGIRYLKWLFVAAALALGGVGMFPYVADSILATLHNGSAFSLVIIIVSMIVGVRWFAPWLSSEFLMTSYGIGAGLILAIVLFMGVGYLSLTAFELVAFGISFTWLVLLLRNLQYGTQGR